MANVAFFSASDDLLTYLLFDFTVFGEAEISGRRTGKMDSEMKPLRINSVEINSTQHIVQSLRSGAMDLNQAIELFCRMNVIVNFLNKWEDSEDLFEDHLKRYFGALLPRSGIAFHETDRYTRPIKTAKFRQTPSPTPPPPSESHSHHHNPDSFIDVAVFATRDYKVGEIIELKGGLVELTEEEDDKFRASGSKMDFSVLWSSRKDCFCLLLGPARFVNHDCRNNVEFMPIGSHMKFKVVEPIAANEQIFTRYGDHYFDQDNSSCLCSTCEQLKRGAFSLLPPPPPAAVVASGSNTLQIPLAPRRTPSTSSDSSLSSIASSEASTSSLISSTSARPIGRPRKSTTTTSITITTTTTTKNKTLSKTRSKNQEEKRRSERTNVILDEFRTRPRLVHPPLAPPPGYAQDYKWDPKKKTLEFFGRKQIDLEKERQKKLKEEKREKELKEKLEKKEKKEREKKSKASLGKRKRYDSSSDEDDDEDDEDSDSEEDSSDDDRPATKKRIVKDKKSKSKPQRKQIRKSRVTTQIKRKQGGRGRGRKFLKENKGYKKQKPVDDSDESSSSSEEESTDWESSSDEEYSKKYKKSKKAVKAKRGSQDSSSSDSGEEEFVKRLLTPKKYKKKKSSKKMDVDSDEEVVKRGRGRPRNDSKDDKEKNKSNSRKEKVVVRKTRKAPRVVVKKIKHSWYYVDRNDSESESDSDEHKQVSDSTRPDAFPSTSTATTATSEVRSTRRHSLLPSVSIITIRDRKPRLSNPYPIASTSKSNDDNPSRRITSRQSLPNQNFLRDLSTSPPHQTRAKSPIKVALTDLVYSKAVVGGIGGWDEKAGKYVSPISPKGKGKQKTEAAGE